MNKMNPIDKYEDPVKVASLLNSMKRLQVLANNLKEEYGLLEKQLNPVLLPLMPYPKDTMEPEHMAKSPLGEDCSKLEDSLKDTREAFQNLRERLDV